MSSRMRERRVATGLSQAQLARRVGLKGSWTLNRVENGARPSYDTAQKIAAALGCKVCDIWPGCVLRGLIRVPGQEQEVKP